MAKRKKRRARDIEKDYPASQGIVRILREVFQFSDDAEFEVVHH